MSTAPTVREAGSRGGLSRSRSLSAERKREIALTASHAAALKRRGLPTEKELIKAYLRRVREEDPELARFSEVVANAPKKYHWALAGVLPEQEQRFALEIFDEVLREMFRRKG